MKAVDRLIIKAKRKAGSDLKLSFGMIYRSEKEPGKWIARGDLWNGIPYGNPKHKAEYVTCICDSIEEAEKALNELSDKYPNNKDIVIIVDDLDQ